MIGKHSWATSVIVVNKAKYIYVVRSKDKVTSAAFTGSNLCPSMIRTNRSYASACFVPGIAKGNSTWRREHIGVAFALRAGIEITCDDDGKTLGIFCETLFGKEGALSAGSLTFVVEMGVGKEESFATLAVTQDGPADNTTCGSIPADTDAVRCL